MSEQETVTVKIPKATANYIRSMEWLKFYDGLDDFVTEAVREYILRLRRAGIK